MPMSHESWPNMPEPVQHTLKKVLAQIRKPLDGHIDAVILYGSLAREEYIEGHSNINLLIILQSCSLENLQHCCRLSERWKKDGVVAPLVLTNQELSQSFQLFPIEYFEMKENHVLLEGRDPFLTLHVDDHMLAQHSQRELSGNLLRVRQRFIEGQGRVEAIPALLSLSLTALLPALRGVCRALGHPSNGTSVNFLKNLPQVLELNEQVFLEVLEMKQGSRTPGKLSLPDLFIRYVQGLELVISRVGQELRTVS